MGFLSQDIARFRIWSAQTLLSSKIYSDGNLSGRKEMKRRSIGISRIPRQLKLLISTSNFWYPGHPGHMERVALVQLRAPPNAANYACELHPRKRSTLWSWYLLWIYIVVLVLWCSMMFYDVLWCISSPLWIFGLLEARGPGLAQRVREKAGLQGASTWIWWQPQKVMV